MTLDELHAHPMYHLLTTRQQMFVNKYIETNGDRVAAIQCAYKHSRPDIAALKLLRSTYIRRLLAAYYNYAVDETGMSKTELVGLLAARMRRESTKDGDFVDLADMWLEITGRKKRLKRGVKSNEEKEQMADEGTSQIDKLVQQIEMEKKALTKPLLVVPNKGKQNE